MCDHIKELFENREIAEKISIRLPYLFQLAELESSRAGKIGMEIGSVRERIIISLLIYKYGEENVDTNIPITEPWVDVKLFKSPISIKSITGKLLSGIELIWTVDAQKAIGFGDKYFPSCEILFVQINWNDLGGFYSIPLETQIRVFNKIGRQNYIKLPNSREQNFSCVGK